MVRTSEESCFRVCVKFLLASAKAFVSSFGFLACDSPLLSEAAPGAGAAPRDAADPPSLLLRDFRLKASDVFGVWVWFGMSFRRMI